MEISIIIKIAAGIAGLIGAFFAIIKFYHWLYPISVRPSFTLNFDNGKTPDSISAIVTNKSSETHYMVSCSARGTYSIWHILKRHITRPLLKPSLYPNVWHHGPVYKLMKSEPIKIEPRQQVEVFCEVYEHPLNAMYTPFFVITAQLSTDHKVRSKKIQAPGRWRFIGRHHLNPNA